MRLHDDDKDPVLVECARLLNAASPLDPTGAMEARVKRAVLQGGSRRAAGWLRPALALALLVAMFSSAAALIGKYNAWSRAQRARDAAALSAAAPHCVEQPVVAPVGPALRVASATKRKTARASRAVAMSPTAVAESTAPAANGVTLPAANGVAMPAANGVAMGSSASIASAPALATSAVAPPASPAEAKLVMEAIAALRNAHDSALARERFDRYLREYPNGALTEEVIAYSIEAAQGSADVVARCQEYLERYPNGRFAEVARRTLAKHDAD